MDKFDKRYEKFKDNNLPTPFYDEERKVFEYVSFNENLFVDSDLIYPLGDISWSYLLYPYYIKDYARLENDNKAKLQLFHSHSHNFKDVLYDLYMHPESFKISDEDKEYYSRQELDYLDKIQKFLNLIKLKDIYKGKKNRYNNNLYNKYKEAHFIRLDNDIINLMINNKLNYIVSSINYDIGKTFLILDKENNYKLFIKTTNKERCLYSDIKMYYPNDVYKDDTKLNKYSFEIVEYLNK